MGKYNLLIIATYKLIEHIVHNNLIMSMLWSSCECDNNCCRMPNMFELEFMYMFLFKMSNLVRVPWWSQS